jgi:hypothetical protein
MPRAGYLILLALLLAAAAAGVLVWTKYIELPGSRAPTPSVPSDVSTQDSSEAKWGQVMSQQAAGGGFTATFSEQDLGKWIVTENQKMERFSMGSAESIFARFTSTSPLDSSSDHWLAQGISVVIPLHIAEQSNGRTIEIGMVSRSAQSNGSPSLGVVYATQQSGNSGWKQVPLTASFALHKFTYDVPKLEAGYTNKPVVVIHSDPEGANRSIEIIGLYVKVVK